MAFRRGWFAALAGAAILAVAMGGASAQDKTLQQQIAGTWVLVTNSGKGEGVGPNATGVVIFDRSGYFALEIVGEDVPPFASGDRQNGTASENQASVRGSLAYYGTYTTDSASHSVIFHITRSSFPNWSGADQKWVVSATANGLTWTDPASGGSSTLVWTRASSPVPSISTRGGRRIVH
jgi:hypothetical protein